ncbi:Lipoprotein lplA [Serratia fonticola]|uniref:Lipoprotein lplA n=1 Tax=Serratia fonticola TaxID=47917 RepID=A0A4V6KNH2_SERFO|nr:Lipoprotein lplA [Serratia fonticola]
MANITACLLLRRPSPLFVRKDWREKLGLPQPKTWQDVATLAKAFTTQDPDGNGKSDTYGFLLPASTTRGYASWFMSAFLWQAGGDFIREVGAGANLKPHSMNLRRQKPCSLCATCCAKR